MNITVSYVPAFLGLKPFHGSKFILLCLDQSMSCLSVQFYQSIRIHNKLTFLMELSLSFLVVLAHFDLDSFGSHKYLFFFFWLTLTTQHSITIFGKVFFPLIFSESLQGRIMSISLSLCPPLYHLCYMAMNLESALINFE